MDKRGGSRFRLGVAGAVGSIWVALTVGFVGLVAIVGFKNFPVGVAGDRPTVTIAQSGAAGSSTARALGGAASAVAAGSVVGGAGGGAVGAGAGGTAGAGLGAPAAAPGGSGPFAGGARGPGAPTAPGGVAPGGPGTGGPGSPGAPQPGPTGGPSGTGNPLNNLLYGVDQTLNGAIDVDPNLTGATQPLTVGVDTLLVAVTGQDLGGIAHTLTDPLPGPSLIGGAGSGLLQTGLLPGQQASGR